MKINLSIFSFLAFLLLLNCKENKKKVIQDDDRSQSGNPAKEQTDKNLPLEKTQLQIVGEKVIVPDFTLEVNLSDEAVKKLQNSKESVIASFYLYGDVTDEDLLPEEFKKVLGPTGVKLTSMELEEQNIGQTNKFEVTGMSFPKKLYDLLADKDILIGINVYSGRRAFKDNILYMEAYDSKLSDIITHSSYINLNGRLLTEDMK